MRSLFQGESPEPQRLSRTTGISISIHAAVLVLAIIGTLHAHRTIIFRPMTQGSVTNVSTVSISQGALAAALAPKTPVVQKPAPHLRVVPKPQPLPADAAVALPSQAAPPAPSPQTAEEKSTSNAAGAGSDAQNMYPAYPVVSPSPQVKDRSLLPATDQRVIVDVNLSVQGQVQQATLVSGLGNSLDQLVLDTVRGWQFHPAMLNGSPVPSSMELVFPFNRSYPMAE
jgi:TonB family protein